MTEYKSSLITVSKTNFGTQLTLLLLHAGLVQKCFFVGKGWSWALIKFLGFQKKKKSFWAFRVRAY